MLRLLRTPKIGPAGEPDRAQAQGGPDDPLRALAAAATHGDREAQRTLLVAIGPSLFRIVRGVLGNAHPDVDDTLQEAMVAVHLALRSSRGECTTLHFACRVAVQTAMNARRKAGYRSRLTPNMAPADLVDLARDDSSPSKLVEADGGAKRCGSCCASCPRCKRKCSHYTRCSVIRWKRLRPRPKFQSTLCGVACVTRSPACANACNRARP